MLSNTESDSPPLLLSIDEPPIEPVMKKAKVEEDSQSAKKPSNTGSLIRQDLKLLLANHEGKRED